MLRRLAYLGFAFLAFSSIASCAGAGDDSDTDEVTAPDDDLTASASTELYLRAGDTSLWMNQLLTRRNGASGPEYVLHGRTSRDIVDGRGYVFDDVYGDFTHPTARTFDVSFPLVSNIRNLIDGVPELIGLTFKHSSTRPDSLTARAIVRPRLISFSGSSKVYITAELTPVVVGGTVVYRIKGHTTGAGDVVSVIQVLAAGVAISDTRVVDPTHFEVDLLPDHIMALAGVPTADLQFNLWLPSGNAVKHAKLGLSIKKLGFTAGDVETVWPHMTCTTQTRSCLTALPDGTLDLASCGEAIAVNACAGQVGVFVDDVGFQATLDKANTQLSTPAFRSDAIGLVGADRVEPYLDNTKQSVEGALEHLYGRWYLSVTTRDAAMNKALDDAIDIAVARPMELIEAHPVVAGNVPATRQVVADALLTYLSTQDLRITEWGRTLEELAHEFRAQHVQSIRNFRENVSPEPWPSHPEWDLYNGDWLGAHVEVTVLKSTGAVVNVLLEID